MKKKVIIISVVIILLILLFPIRNQLKDGGTVEWASLTYKISKVHRLNSKSKTGYDDGIVIEVLGVKVYDSVVVNTSNINHENEVKKITWEEITPDGVNEELLIKSVDEELLMQIATEFQTLMEEEEAEERKNPEIVITDGWTRVFKSERYAKVLNMGDSAMKPLYDYLPKSIKV